MYCTYRCTNSTYTVQTVHIADKLQQKKKNFFFCCNLSAICTVCASIGGVLDTPPTQLLKMLGVSAERNVKVIN